MTVQSRNLVLAAVLGSSLVLGGCATGPYGDGGYRSHDGYQSSGYGTTRCPNCGVVQDVQQVYVQNGGHGTLGAVIGAVAGGVLGNQIGKGNGRKAATVAGAVAGGVVGNQVGKRTGNGDVPAWRITVRLDNGQYATVTQSEDPGLRVGDYVQVRGDHVYAM
ncbi:glycine zipper 2TM domain-containing protein [Frateuria sp.]|uniref:glycine zipper 2TM domain-containing protein n=1 Tax=Frateuria sp. TaxID=2211372 RepID=UPI001859B6E9|nr:glycine zipper 2TM domain-containing protein [Frateuria sp.]NUR23461.1 glycine zipper 2TM domain-containing protein [Frateuria sp.]